MIYQTSSAPTPCTRCGRDCGSHWTIVAGLNVCDWCMREENRYCRHGQLARSCEICELEADLESQAEYVKELQARLAWLQKTLTGRQRRHYASALRQLRNFRDGLREARALYAEKSGKPDRFDDPSAWWQNPRDKSVVLWLIEWAEDVQGELMEQLGKERDALAAENMRLRAMLRRWLEGSFAAPELEEQTRAALTQSPGGDHEPA